ncbi:putative phosphatase [Rothia aerolata]|uniref:Phosphatase n=2 Tax=Rothia aerolata TaxID=1812262 RepID=A0A917IQM4_9MICC|nr:putative phosphatase [Rothia aerolata]
MHLKPFSMTDREFADYLKESRICGEVATARENNISHMHGFVEGNEHLEFGVKWTRDWTFEQVFDLMAARVGTSADPDFLEGVDTISAEKCIAALYDYARIFGEAVAGKKKLLFATGHPAGLFPIYAELARAARAAGASVLEIQEGDLFLDGDIRQIMDVVMFEQYGNLQHTHFPGPMQLALAQLAQTGEEPDLVIADHGMAGFAASAGLATIGIADCNDPGLFVSAEQGQILVAVPMDDNVTPHLYQPIIEFILTKAGLL